jgi:hypothetical protein
MKLKDKIAKLRRAVPKHTASGQLYAKIIETRRLYTRVTLYTLFVSNENTHMLRDHVFNCIDPRTPKQWAEWFTEHLQDIHRQAVLPGIAVRTNKQWAVQRIIGWVGNAKHSTRPPAVGRKRNKALKKGRKNG